jgi:quercetin dioxygenase-like cupin family protein
MTNSKTDAPDSGPAPELRFLAGKVWKRTLPLLEVPLGPDAPALKRLLLPQGELAQFYDADAGVRYMASIELRAGSIRGNHYHKTKEEFIYVMGGEVLLVVEDIATPGRASVPLRAGDLAFIATGVAHALQTVTAGHGIEFSTVRFDPIDIHRFKVV